MRSDMDHTVLPANYTMPAFNNRNNKVQPPTKVVTRRQQSDFGYAT